MTSYRGYAIRRDGRIRRGAYLKAQTTGQAQQAAQELCEDGVDHIEVWADAQLIGEVPCHPADSDAEPASSASAS